MPTLHNQTKTKLSWDMGGRNYDCDPWGSVDVPDRLVGACKSRGLPLAPVPVAPELRARVRIADEEQATLDSDLRKWSDRARAAEVERDEAKAQLDLAQVALSEAGDKLRGAKVENEKLRAELKTLRSDKAAAEELVSETAAKAAESEERALRAEARLQDSSKKRK